MIRRSFVYLQDISGIDPKDIPTDDPEVYKLFYSTESLGVTPEQIRSTTDHMEYLSWNPIRS